MKKLGFKSLFLTACTIILIACDKNELAVQEQITSPTKTNIVKYVPPIVTGLPGNYFRSIDTICPSYLQYTIKIDITGKQNNQVFPELSDGNLVITQLNSDGHTISFTKRDPATNEWWKDWNVIPLVESRNPPVLYVSQAYSTTLLLSKHCYVFGFELGAPLIKTNPLPFQMYVDYLDRDLGRYPIGVMRQYVSAPNGARLFAIKSDIPFDRVIIFFDDVTVPRDYAITNVRYITNKDVYDKHKND